MKYPLHVVERPGNTLEPYAIADADNMIVCKVMQRASGPGPSPTGSSARPIVGTAGASSFARIRATTGERNPDWPDQSRRRGAADEERRFVSFSGLYNVQMGGSRKTARAALGCCVRELAQQAGLTANTVTRIESGADAKR